MAYFPARLLLVLGAVAAMLAACSGNNPPPAPENLSFVRFDEGVSQPATGLKTNDLTLAFNGGQMAGWSAGKPASTCTAKDNMLVFRCMEGDYLSTPPGLHIDGHSTDTIEIKMQVSVAGKVALTWNPKGMGWTENHRIFNIYVSHPGEMVTYNAQVSGVKAWRHREIDQLRLTVENAAEIELESIRVVSRQSVFAAETIGVREYSIGDRVRPCLFAHGSIPVEYTDVVIPRWAKFSAGLGLIDESSPVTFTVNLKTDTETIPVMSQLVADAAQWQDVEVDLSAHAGKKGTFVLQASAKPDQVVLWSNPVLFQTRAPGKDRQPLNVLLYVVDALRADHLDVYGYGRETGPHISAFAAQGARFDRCYSQDTWTKPSMASLAMGVGELVHKVEVYGDMAPDALEMLPGLLRDQGYVTGAITENPHTPPDANQRRVYCNTEPTHLRAELGDQVMKWNELPEETYQAAAKFMETNRDRPFFLYVHTMEAHDIPVEHPADHYVYDPPEKFRYKWAKAGEPDPAPMDLYDAGIAFADENFQRVLDKLEALHLAENTLVIFMGDHGEAFGEHDGKFGHAGKPYNELIHIPLIMKLPGRLAKDTTVADNVALIDVPPTILDLLNLQPCSQFQGSSLRDLMAGGAQSNFREHPIFSRWAGYSSAVQGTWKLFDDPYAPRRMLFDLARDPGEKQDVSGANPQMRDALSRALDEYVKQQAALAEALHVQKDTGIVQTMDPRKAEQLNAMGYIGAKNDAGKEAKPPAMDEQLKEQLQGLGYVGVQRDASQKLAAPKIDFKPAPSPATPTGPADCNVIVIVIDTLRADHLGCYGYNRDTSPCIDSLAANGVLYERALSNASYTCMSVASLLSGILPSKSPTGTGWLAAPNPATQNMGELFSRAGYATGFFSNHPTFNEMSGFLGGFMESALIETEWGKSGSNNQLSLRAVDFLKRHSAEKTMLYMHYLDPHGPYEPSKENYLAFASKISEHPVGVNDAFKQRLPELVAGGFGPGEERFEDLVARYDGEILGADQAIQTLIQALKDQALYDKTMVVVTADHGEEFLEHGFVEHAWHVYTESIHVPLIVHAPKFIKPARIKEHVSLIDIMPTLLEVMKIPNTRTDLDGSVLCAEENGMLTFHGQSKPIISEILMENRGLERSVIDKDCAYIGAVRWLTPNECSKVAFLEKDQLVQIKKHGFPVSDIWGPVTHEAFYDLAADPGERKPLEREARPAFAELRNVYTNYMNVCKGVTGGVEKQPAAK